MIFSESSFVILVLADLVGLGRTRVESEVSQDGEEVVSESSRPEIWPISASLSCYL